jgi:23S rRNA (cytidine2498-2'-O)-methyltransferase
MSEILEAEFVFVLCNPGSEKAVKSEAESLGWRLCYQRRGFVSFKKEGRFNVGDLDVGLTCARRVCLSLGKAESRAAAEALLQSLSADFSVKTIHQAKYQDRKMMGLGAVGDEVSIRYGDGVATVVELGEQEFWVGVHRHQRYLSPDPAGDPGIQMPVHSPSRAWLKLEEAMRFFDLSFGQNEVVVELGSSPGGVVLALLDRQVSVIGVDPAKMAEVVLARSVERREDASKERPWFYHCKKPAALVSKKDLGEGVTWFMSDMNQSPEVVMKECARFCKMSPSIRGVLMTFKLTDLMAIERKQQWFEGLSQLGFRTMRLQQLSAHHKEVALWAMRG